MGSGTHDSWVQSAKAEFVVRGWSLLGVASQFMDLGNLLSQRGYCFDSFDPGLQCQARTRDEFELQRPVNSIALTTNSAFEDDF